MCFAMDWHLPSRLCRCLLPYAAWDKPQSPFPSQDKMCPELLSWQLTKFYVFKIPESTCPTPRAEARFKIPPYLSISHPVKEGQPTNERFSKTAFLVSVAAYFATNHSDDRVLCVLHECLCTVKFCISRSSQTSQNFIIYC